MSGLKQELGLAQGVGLLLTSLSGIGVFAVPALATLVTGNNSLWTWPALIVLVFPVVIVFAILGRHLLSAGGVAHFVDMAFDLRLERVTGWLFLSVILVGLSAALHTAVGFGQVMFGWHDEQLLLVEPGMLALVWYIGSRSASPSASLQTVITGLTVALVVATWWAGDLTPGEIPFPAITNTELPGLFAVLSVMFWRFVGLEVFTHLTSEFKNPERDFPCTLMIGLLLVGSTYWACTIVVLHSGAYGEQMVVATSPPEIAVQLSGVQVLQVARIVGYLACFASLNIYIQSFARLVWSQVQCKPESYLARLSPRRLPRSAPNAVLGCCVVSTLCIYMLQINLDMLVVYVNGISITTYLLCMLAGCRLLKGHYRVLTVIGGLPCLLLLAMVGWESLYALTMLVGLWLFLPRRPDKATLTPSFGLQTLLSDDANAYPAYILTFNPDDRPYVRYCRAYHPYAEIRHQKSHRYLLRR